MAEGVTSRFSQEDLKMEFIWECSSQEQMSQNKILVREVLIKVYILIFPFQVTGLILRGGR